MHDDPLMPATHRFPRDPWPSPGSDAPPSDVRPFGLRGLGPASTLLSARHRTTPYRTAQKYKTNMDNREEDDTWYTDDD